MCYTCKEVDCQTVCKAYNDDPCKELQKPPYVCNVCSRRRKCKSDRAYYTAQIGALVNVQTIEVLLHDQTGGVALGIALRLVDLHQHIKGVDKNMAGTHAGVDDFDIFGIQPGIVLAKLGQM